MKKNKYTFLEWVFDRVGFGKFILSFYIFLILIGFTILSFIWWYTKDYR
jgi:hypothetical protein